MPPCRKRPLLRLLSACLLALAGGLLGGCATTGMERNAAQAARVSPMTGRILTDHELRSTVPGAILGEAVYAEVNSEWLAHWYGTFRAKLFKIGLTRWDSRFDCNRFADFYANLAHAFFALEMYRSSSPAQALALGPFWYIRANGQGTHAIVQAVTERGRIFIDPQTGLEMKLSLLEEESGYVQLF